MWGWVRNHSSAEVTSVVPLLRPIKVCWDSGGIRTFCLLPFLLCAWTLRAWQRLICKSMQPFFIYYFVFTKTLKAAAAAVQTGPSARREACWCGSCWSQTLWASHYLSRFAKSKMSDEGENLNPSPSTPNGGGGLIENWLVFFYYMLPVFNVPSRMFSHKNGEFHRLY